MDLHTVDAIKFGEYKLKSGIVSPYYFDFRILVSYPHLLEVASDVFWEKLRVMYLDVIVGVPYTGIPIATAVCVGHRQTMIFVRKEAKDYGTRKLVEGVYHSGQVAVIVDDVITNGESKLETIRPLEEAGLTVQDIVVLVDREQGGVELLRHQGYRCQTIFKVDQIFDLLLEHKRVPRKIIQQCLQFNRESRRQFLTQSKKGLK